MLNCFATCCVSISHLDPYHSLTLVFSVSPKTPTFLDLLRVLEEDWVEVEDEILADAKETITSEHGSESHHPSLNSDGGFDHHPKVLTCLQQVS